MTSLDLDTLPPAIGEEILRHIDELAACSEAPDNLTRTYLSDQHARANALVLAWMREAGMTGRVDAVGNAVGRYEGRRAGGPALILGSHLDTVRNAGKYDGMLGVVTAIACVKALHQAGERPDFAIEVVGFGDEEGVRFQSTLLGSRALAGTFAPALLDKQDAAGVTLAEAMRAFGLDPGRIGEAAHRPEEVLAYVELHIEQGPVLEAEGLPVGVVTSIAGATRLLASLKGMAGHAGTVPMDIRRDPLPAAAEAVLAVERLCSGTPGLVGTVGRIEALPGAVNVIPGEARFSIDIRAGEDAPRQAAVARVRAELQAIAERRGLTLTIETTHESPSCPCARWLIEQIAAAVAATAGEGAAGENVAGGGVAVRHLPSGAGHDAMAMADLTDVGMIFVRCAGGISHNPAEAITREDAAAGARTLLHFLRHFRPPAA